MKTDLEVETADHPQTSLMQYAALARRFAVRLCIVVTVVVFLLAAVEIYAFLHFHPNVNALELGAELEMAQNESPAEREYWVEFKKANKVTYHPWVLWRRQPFQGEMISIDQDGVRRTLHTQCDDKTFTIWMFGDSVMWGAGAPDPDTIASYIADDYQKAGRPVCIVNYAEKGWVNTQEVIGLMEELKHAQRKPDEVLFYDGGTEAFTVYQSNALDVHSNYLSFKNFLDNWGAYERPGFSYLTQTNTNRLLKKMGSKVDGKTQPTAPTPTAKLDTEAAKTSRRNRSELRSEHGICGIAGEAVQVPSRICLVSQYGGGAQSSRPMSNRCSPPNIVSFPASACSTRPHTSGAGIESPGPALSWRHAGRSERLALCRHLAFKAGGQPDRGRSSIQHSGKSRKRGADFSLTNDRWQRTPECRQECRARTPRTWPQTR